MNVRVRLFAIARQLAGSEAADLELPAKPTVADLRAALVARYPQLGNMSRHLAFAVNAEYAGDETSIPEDAELACIPPVSGG